MAVENITPDQLEAMEEAIRMMKAVGIANPEVRPMSIPIRCREV